MATLRLIQPAVMSTPEAEEYVGNSRIWKKLLKHYPKILLPLDRTGKRGDAYWLRALIDRILDVAQAEGTLLLDVSGED